MKQMLPMMLALGLLCACSGTDSQRRSQNPPQAGPIEPAAAEAPADPFDAACEAGAARSCLLSAQEAEKRGDYPRAIESYRKACHQGEPTGCLLAGGLLLEREDAMVEAAALLSKACEEGEAAGCHGVGLIHEGVYGGTADVEAAAKSYREACDRGVFESCARLGSMLLRGEGVTRNVEEGVAVLRKACDAGEASACLTLGNHLMQQGEQEPATARLTTACDGGEGRACTLLGMAGVRASNGSDAAAADWFARGCAASAPDVHSCALWGWALWRGPEQTRDRAKAAALFRDTCEAGSASGCLFLGIAHRVGGPLEKDEARADELLGRACELEPKRCDWFRERFANYRD